MCSGKLKFPARVGHLQLSGADKVFIATSVSDEETDKGEGGASSALSIVLNSTVWKNRRANNCGSELLSRAPRSSQNTAGNTYASETPVTDGERVYVYFGMIGVYCYDLAGNPVWKKDLGAYPMDGNWGTGSSPVLHGDHLYLQID